MISTELFCYFWLFIFLIDVDVIDQFYTGEKDWGMKKKNKTQSMGSPGL